MKRNLTTWLSILSLFFTFISCEDHRIPTQQRFRIKKVTKQGNNQISTDTYSYDNQGRLDNIYKAYSQRSRGSNRDYYYTTVFQYDAQGKPSSVVYQPDNTAPGTIVPNRFDYTYDANGYITTVKTDGNTVRYVYDNAMFPVKITYTNDLSNEGYTIEYTYDKGNVVKTKFNYVNSTGATIDFMSYTMTYQFDDHPNPFYNLYIGAPDPDMFGDYDFGLNTFYQSNTFNKNNMIYPDLTYEYDANGNLIKITGSVTTTFDYEAY